jgi:hypothetical protein
MVSNRRPFSFNFIFGNRKKSQGAKSGEYVGWGMTGILFFARNCWARTEVCDGALSWWSSQVCSRWLRHGACPNLPPEPVGMSHNQFPPHQQCREWSDVDPDRRALEFVQQFKELCNFWISPCVCLCHLMCNRSWTVNAIETPAHDSNFGPQRLVESLWGLRSTFLKIGTKFDALHTCCSYLWSIVKIATGHLHDSKQMCVKTDHVHPATCSLVHWLTRHGSPTIHWCFALPQLLDRSRHSPAATCILPRRRT